MRISGEGRIGLWLGLIGLAGAGAIMVAPDHTGIGWTLIAIALAGAAALLSHHLCESFRLSWLPGDRRNIVAMTFLIYGVASLGFLSAYFWIEGDAPHGGPDLVANFKFPDPLQIGTSSVKASYRFQNASARAVLISEIGLIEVFSKDKAFGGKATDVCLNPSLGWVDIFPDYNDIARGLPTAMWDARGAWMEGTSFVLRHPQAQETPVTIQPMSLAVVAATFDARFPNLSGDIATVALCPVTKTYDKDGRGITAICRGIAIAISSYSGDTSESLVTGAPPAWRILPSATKSDCQILITPSSRRD